MYKLICSICIVTTVDTISLKISLIGSLFLKTVLSAFSCLRSVKVAVHSDFNAHLISDFTAARYQDFKLW